MSARTIQGIDVSFNKVAGHISWIVYPGRHTYRVHEKITVWPLWKVEDLLNQIS